MKVQNIQQYNQHFKGVQSTKIATHSSKVIVGKSAVEQLSKIEEAAERVTKKYADPIFREERQRSSELLNLALQKLEEKLEVSKEQLLKPFDI